MDHTYLFRHSRFYESLMEHRFIYDLARYFAMQTPPRYLNVLRSEVDMFGFDLVLSLDGQTRHLQLKTRSNSPSSNPYNISESIWRTPCSCVIWILYSSEKLEPINYWMLGCPLRSIEEFNASPRPMFRHVRMQSSNHQKKNIEEIANSLFPSGDSSKAP